MKKNVLLSILLLCQSLFSHLVAGQTPDLGAASSFALFTGNGSVSNTGGLTGITGDVGTNGDAVTGFPVDGIIGTTHVQDGTTNQARQDVMAAYSYLTGLDSPVVPALSATLGGPELTPQVLAPGQYGFGGALSVNDVLALDGQHNPNAVFVFQVNGPLTTGAGARIKLLNGASPSRIFWQVNGDVGFAALTRFSGVIIADGAIAFGDRARLEGLVLTQIF